MAKIQNTSKQMKGYDNVLAELVSLLESARKTTARSINTILTATYWEVGRRIVEYEQGGRGKAEYGEQLVERLSKDLTKKFGRGFGRSNLFQMRSFYLAYPAIIQTASGKLDEATRPLIVQTPSAKSSQTTPSVRFPLPWSHYVLLLSLNNPTARSFYEQEALRGGWSVRQLERQITTKFYERALLSKNKAAMLKKGAPEDPLSPEEEIKDPFVLEFLGLKDEYSESDIEEALIRKLESFLLELGGDFAFIGRQRRLRVGDEWYRVDLMFFHRRLRCLVLIDLKLGKFTHADAGQMHLYLNYAKENWAHAGENPPVGLILCTHKDAAVAHYSLEGLPNKVLAAEYRMALPDEKTLAAELGRTRRILEARPAAKMGRKK